MTELEFHHLKHLTLIASRTRNVDKCRPTFERLEHSNHDKTRPFGESPVLERVEEVRGDGPDGEEDPRASQGVGPHVVQDVGDAEQRQEEEQRLERLPARRGKVP